MTYVNFITENRMLQNTHLFENKIITKWIKASLGVRKERIEFCQLKVKSKQEFEKALEGLSLKDL